MTLIQPEPPLVVSVQSQVAFGHVGNSAAAFPMRASGVEVVEVPTALLSNHPHYSTMHGTILDAELVGGLLTGIAERGVAARASVLLSGFLGRAETAETLAAFLVRARADNPGLVYLCDPVMGDADLGHFVDAPLRRAFAARLVPLADVILPNAFELENLSGIAIAGPDDVARARKVLGCPAVVATSVPVAGQPGLLATVVATADTCHSFEVARLPVRPAGTGDLLAGLTAARLAQGMALPEAVGRAVAGVTQALLRTSGEPWAEMPIAASIDAILGAEWQKPGGGALTNPG